MKGHVANVPESEAELWPVVEGGGLLLVVGANILAPAGAEKAAPSQVQSKQIQVEQPWFSFDSKRTNSVWAKTDTLHEKMTPERDPKQSFLRGTWRPTILELRGITIGSWA